jgi:tetratricopeptide (TPR) repeat protein
MAMNIEQLIQSALQHQQAGNLKQAEQIYNEVLKVQPNNVYALHFLGLIFYQQKEYDSAITHIKEALHFAPNYADAYSNLGIVLQEMGQRYEAKVCYEKALQLKPSLIANISSFQDSKKKDFDLAKKLLHDGNFIEGWKKLWETQDSHFMSLFPQPLWDGSDIKGKTILLYPAWGFGDTFQFIRYIPIVTERNAKVIVVCHEALSSLIGNINGVQEVVTHESKIHFDVHSPIPRLPIVFGTEIENIPTKCPYITVNPTLIKKWREKLQNHGAKLKIGVVWATERDPSRSCPFNLFRYLTSIDGVTFYSLQKGESSKQAKNLQTMINLIDYTEEINNFSDTAALIENLDLVISVDTAVANLAGALGKSVWTLIPFIGDWKWVLNKNNNPIWYPTMRFFRQPSAGDWEPVIVKVKDELLKVLGHT